METFICPTCQKELSDTGTITPGPGERPGSMPIETLYCASCEMLVVPLVSVSLRVSVNAADNRGRIRSSGSNAGGSQRGTLPIMALLSGEQIQEKRSVIPGKTKIKRHDPLSSISVRKVTSIGPAAHA